MKAHSLYSPSAAERWMACPASVRLTQVARERGMSFEESTSYAEVGSYAMAILEDAIRRGIAIREALRQSNLPRPEGFADTDAGALEVSRVRISEALSGADEWGCEERVDIVPSFGVFGTCDFWARHGDRVTVIDYKHGAGVMVEAKGNLQIGLYALGLSERFPQAKAFRLAICQPRGAGWTEETVGVCYLRDLRNRVMETILFDVSEPKAGKHCRWCPAALVCPVRIEEAKRVIAMTETDLHDADNLRFLVEAGTRVTKLIEMAKTVAVRRMRAGAEIEGLELVEGPGRLVWRDGAVEALREEYGDEAFETQAMSPARVRDNLPGGEGFVERWAERKPGFFSARAVDKGGDAE